MTEPVSGAVRVGVSPRTRKVPEMPGEDFEKVVDESQYIFVTEDGYCVEYTVPTRRLDLFKVGFEAAHPYLDEVVEFEVGPAATDITVPVRTAESAFGALDAILEVLGKCRVCGDIECHRGFVYTDTDIVHRDEIESPHE